MTIRIVLLQKLLYYPRPMGSRIVILQYDVVMLNDRQTNWLQHFIDEALACQSSVKHNQLCTAMNAYASHAI